MNVANRTVWTLVGLLLLGLGALGVLASTRRLAFIDSASPLLTTDMVRRWHEAGALAPLTTAVAGLLIAAAGAWFVRRQIPLRRRQLTDPVLVEPGPPRADEHGLLRVQVASTALSRALSRDLCRDRRVRRARVQLTGPTYRPELQLNLTVHGNADLVSLSESVDESLQRWRTTTGLDARLTDVTVKPPDEPPTRVA